MKRDRGRTSASALSRTALPQIGLAAPLDIESASFISISEKVDTSGAAATPFIKRQIDKLAYCSSAAPIAGTFLRLASERFA